MVKEDKKISEVKNEDVIEVDTPVLIVDSPTEVREYLRDVGYITEHYSE